MIPALRDKAVTPRYAVYWTPPADHPLWRAGCDWLGRDAERAQVDRPGEGPEALTRAPRRYGFHATLKAPMRLRGAADTLAKTVQAGSNPYESHWKGKVSGLAMPPNKVAISEADTKKLVAWILKL